MLYHEMVWRFVRQILSAFLKFQINTKNYPKKIINSKYITQVFFIILSRQMSINKSSLRTILWKKNEEQVGRHKVY